MCSTAHKTCSISKCVLPLIGGGFHSAILMMAGDLMAQTFIENKITEVDVQKIDFRRTAKFGAIGLVYVGPIVSFWRGILNRFITRRARPIEKAINRTISTQIYLAPTVALGIVGLSSIAKEEKVEREIMEQAIQKDYFNIMEKNYMVWPVTQLLCTSLSPTIKFFLLSTASVFWASYLSTVLMAGNSSKQPEVKSEITIEEE